MTESPTPSILHSLFNLIGSVKEIAPFSPTKKSVRSDFDISLFYTNKQNNQPYPQNRANSRNCQFCAVKEIDLGKILSDFSLSRVFYQLLLEEIDFQLLLDQLKAPEVQHRLVKFYFQKKYQSELH